MLFDLFLSCLTANYNKCPGTCDYAIRLAQDKLYVYFKSSDGLRDWLNNFDFPAKAYCNSGEKWYCHRGFLRAWKNISDRLDTRIEDIIKRKKIRELIIVGYSHGAALSLFALEHFSFLYGNTVNVTAYGFGAPRVVFGILPKSVKKRLDKFIIIRNVPDIVTHVPPSFLMYRHVGHLIRIGESGRYGPFSAHAPYPYLFSLHELRRKNPD